MAILETPPIHNPTWLASILSAYHGRTRYQKQTPPLIQDGGDNSSDMFSAFAGAMDRHVEHRSMPWQPCALLLFEGHVCLAITAQAWTLQHLGWISGPHCLFSSRGHLDYEIHQDADTQTCRSRARVFATINLHLVFLSFWVATNRICSAAASAPRPCSQPCPLFTSSSYELRLDQISLNLSRPSSPIT